MRRPAVPPSVKLLFGSAAGALNTVNAYRPLGTAFPPATMLSGPTSMMTSELSLQTIVAQQLATLVLAGRGALRSPIGRAGLALSAASWLALWNLHRAAQGSAAVLDAALVDELGADYRSRIVAPLVPPIDAPFTTTEIASHPAGVGRGTCAPPTPRTASTASGTCSTSGRAPIWHRTRAHRCCCRSPEARGCRAARPVSRTR